MGNTDMLEKFLEQIKQFNHVKIENGNLRNGEINQNRKNVYVLPETKKRWIKIDIKPNSLFISMDHLEGSILLSDVLKIGVEYSQKNGRNGVKVTPSKERFNAVHFTFHKNDSFDFNSEQFKDFIVNHNNAFKKRVGLV